jgi:hypothetical protein
MGYQVSPTHCGPWFFSSGPLPGIKDKWAPSWKVTTTVGQSGTKLLLTLKQMGQHNNAERQSTKKESKRIGLIGRGAMTKVTPF